MVSIINMRIFKTIAVIIPLLAFANFINAAPASFLRLEHRTIDEDSSASPDYADLHVTPTTSTPQPNTYDQRQNGTENYRLQVNGLMVIFGLPDKFIVANSDFGGANDMLSNFGGTTESSVKPKPPLPETDSAANSQHVSEKKSVNRPRLKLMSLLAPFLKRVSIY